MCLKFNLFIGRKGDKRTLGLNVSNRQNLKWFEHTIYTSLQTDFLTIYTSLQTDFYKLFLEEDNGYLISRNYIYV